MADRYEALYRSFRWNVPERYNMALACCGSWAPDRGRFALYWEDESGATAIEYGLIAVLLSVAIIAAVSAVGSEMSGMFGRIDTRNPEPRPTPQRR